MSIVIQNMGRTENNPENLFDGEYEYAIRINDETLNYFTHVRGNGMSDCLRRAANAMDNGGLHPSHIPERFKSSQRR